MIRDVEKNGTMRQWLAMWQQMALELAKKYEPDTAERMAQGIMGLNWEVALLRQSSQQNGKAPAGEIGTANAAHMVRARENSRNVSQPD